jgi:hypothetical protein
MIVGNRTYSREENVAAAAGLGWKIIPGEGTYCPKCKAWLDGLC